MDRLETKQAIAKALRMVREEHGVPVSEAAKQLGVTRQTIYNWENGDRTPSAVDLANAAATYKTTPDVFFEGVFKKGPMDPLAEAEQALVRARRLVRDERRKPREEE